MAALLMLPDDEREVVDLLCSTFGLSMLRDDVLDDSGVPRVIAQPVTLPTTLPDPPAFGVKQVLTYLFWKPSWGVNSVPLTTDEPVDGVARVLTAQSVSAAGVGISALFDAGTTPCIRLTRSGWTNNGLLRTGNLGGMARKLADHPPELLTVLRSAQRAVLKRAIRLEATRDAGSRPWPVYALPAAAQWIDEGGNFYPWSA